VLGRRITAGLVNVKYGHLAKLRRIELNECGHPIPDLSGVAGAERIAAIAESAQRGDFGSVLDFRRSLGAASAAGCAHHPGGEQEVTRLCWLRARTFNEINATRKRHLAHQGRSTGAAGPHRPRLKSLLLSDVIGDDPGVIGSGPTAADATTFGAVFGHFG